VSQFAQKVCRSLISGVEYTVVVLRLRLGDNPTGLLEEFVELEPRINFLAEEGCCFNEWNRHKVPQHDDM
jgi:hypothetical protein